MVASTEALQAAHIDVNVRGLSGKDGGDAMGELRVLQGRLEAMVEPELEAALESHDAVKVADLVVIIALTLTLTGCQGRRSRCRLPENWQDGQVQGSLLQQAAVPNSGAMGCVG